MKLMNLKLTTRPKWTLSCANRPRVPLQLAEEVGERHVALVHGLQELVGWRLRLSAGAKGLSVGTSGLLSALHATASRHGLPCS